MSEKLGIGASFPDITINLVGGGTLDLPGGLERNTRSSCSTEVTGDLFAAGS